MSKRLSIPNKWREKFLEEIFQKYPLFFSSQFKQVKGLKKLKNFFRTSRKWVSISLPFVQIGRGINISWQENMWIVCEHFFEAAHFGYAFWTACANEWRGCFFSVKNFLKKYLSNPRKWVCISPPFVQISRGIKIFLKNTPQKRLSHFKQVEG